MPSPGFENAKIVIIGAGAAGLACAVKLLDSGCKKLQILEAQDRIGGRIHSVPFGNANVDLGAQWCHGEKDNIVFKMVKGKNILGTSRCTYKNNTFYSSSGQKVDKELTDELFGFAAQIMSTMEADKSSFGNYFIKRFIKRVAEEYGANRSCTDVATQFLDWFHKLTLCYDAAPTWFDIATDGLVEYKECDGDPLLNWKNNGYGQFLDILMQNHANKLHAHIIKLNKVVKTIVWDNHKALQAIIHCEDGSLYNADHIILTTSVGVLKEKHHNMFIPELPECKVNAINGIGFGVVNKIMLKFPFKWWGNETCFCFLWNDADRLNVLNQYPVGPMKNGKSWLTDINGFYVVDSDPTVLLGWLLGDLAIEVESLIDKEINDACMFLLEKFLGEFYEIPAPESILVSRWYSNTSFYGSYSYRSIKGEKKMISNADLAEPLLGYNKKPVIQFAGEATHSCYFSTVHGAVESGYREAERIGSCYNE